ncbi:endonuclease/exonuclease/phosphatase family protein [Streptomyces sp. IBSBF 2435]|uniref:endonuclease/exonuclease/phosphatase family protein n=1 Tax=Streptomyces sp. IBSBF 2435 TaxID=2903531 RepID=UPI002FDB9B05
MIRRRLGAVLAAVAAAALVCTGAVVHSAASGESRGERAARGVSAGATTSSVRVLTWNICGESGSCPARNQPDQLMTQVANLAVSRTADAVFLQEVCGNDTENDHAVDSGKTAVKSEVTLLGEKLGSGWTVAFVPYGRPAEDRFGSTMPGAGGTTVEYPPRYANPSATSDFRCRGAELVGVQGIAIAVKGTFGGREEFDLHSPKAGLFLRALCVRRTTGTPVRLCTSHLTPKGEDYDPRAGFSYRAEQVQRLGEIVGDGHDTVFGGDFNTRPPDDPGSGTDSGILAPLYASYHECEQGPSGTARKGSGTMWDSASPPVRADRKYDYLFSKAAFTACQVQTDTSLSAWSDHLPMLATASVTTG